MPASLRRSGLLLLAVLLVLLPLLAGPARAEDPVQVPQGVGSDGVPRYLLPPGAAPTPVRPTTSPYEADYTVRIDGRDRVFRLHVPAGLEGRAAPLVIALHALYSDRTRAQDLMRFERLAASGRFVVVYPQGVGSSWNAGRCCGRAVQERVDDVRALVEVQRLVGLAHPVDPQRRYAAGFSNGGMMALALACARPDVVAGVLVVGGGHLAPCRPGRAVPLLQVHGTADPVVPYGGTSYSDFLRTSVPPVRGTQSLWSGVNAPRSAPTQLVRIVDGDHAWPRTSGTAGTPYDTTGRGWAFLRGQRNSCLPARFAAARPGRERVCG